MYYVYTYNLSNHIKYIYVLFATLYMFTICFLILLIVSIQIQYNNKRDEVGVKATGPMPPSYNTKLRIQF